MLRAAVEVQAFPKKSTPWHSGKVTMIVYGEADPVSPIQDVRSYQWQRKTTGAGSFTNIAGATRAVYEMKGVGNSDEGAYKCIVTFNDGTTKTTNEVAVSRPKALVDGADKNKFHQAIKLYRGKYYQTYARWDVIDKLIFIGTISSANTPALFRAEIAKYKDLAHIYDILERYGSVRFIDSRNGYTYLIDEETCNAAGKKMTVEGPFKNLWPKP